jgi:Mn-dependent DtxR family transcriptional regulator
MNVHKDKVWKMLKEKRVLTTSEIAKELGISWNTAEKMLLEMVIDGKAERMKKEGVNLWMNKL